MYVSQQTTYSYVRVTTNNTQSCTCHRHVRVTGMYVSQACTPCVTMTATSNARASIAVGLFFSWVEQQRQYRACSVNPITPTVSSGGTRTNSIINPITPTVSSDVRIALFLVFYEWPNGHYI